MLLSADLVGTFCGHGDAPTPDVRGPIWQPMTPAMATTHPHYAGRLGRQSVMASVDHGMIRSKSWSQ